MPGSFSRVRGVQLEKMDSRGLRMRDRGRKVVTHGSRGNIDWLRWLPVNCNTGTGREEVMRKGGGEGLRSV